MRSDACLSSTGIMTMPRTHAFVALALLAIFNAACDPLVRGPYLQRAGPTRMVVRWDTTDSVAGEVRYGPRPDQLTQVVTGPVSTVHEIELRDLRPETTYYYSVGSANGILA